MYDEKQGVSPEERLWKAVLILFFQDIQSDVLKYKASLNGSRGFYWNRIQYHLEIAKSKHMKNVCEMAGIDHLRAVKRIKQIIYEEKDVKISRISRSY